MQDADLCRRHAVIRREIVDQPLRGDDDSIGATIKEARRQREQPAPPRPPPTEVAILEKLGGRRLLIEDDARPAAGQPCRRGGDEIAQERHHDGRPLGAEKSGELEEASEPRVPRRRHHPHVRREAVEVHALAAEQVEQPLVPRAVEPAQHGHRHPFGTAPGQRRQHEADFHAAVGTGATARPSSPRTICIMSAAWRSSVCARAV